MISLKDSWQEQRKQRQQEVVQRQQRVGEILAQFQQERQAKAAALREDLRLFQLELQLDTQDFLAEASSQRQARTKQLTEQLHAFVQTLQQQTADFLAMQAADRTLVAQQLFDDLSEFHANLSTSVASLRHDLHQQMQQIRSEVYLLQVETRQILAANQQERIHNQIQLMHDLASWVETLQSSMQAYLTELVQVRHDRAQQVQTMLQQEHDRRDAEMTAFFHNLGVFRSELKAFCTELHQTVWGCHSQEPVPLSAPVKPSSPSKSRTAKLQTPASAKVVLKSEAVTSLPEHIPPAVTPALPVVTPVGVESVSIEKSVYKLIHQTQGARLTEIESALNINRFQAVDALRSLIKKGTVTQRDRTYLIQEEVSL